MITATASQVVLDTLKLFQDQDRVFTAYDITVAARQSTTERVDHDDVRRIVHDEWHKGEFQDHMERTENVLLTTGDYAIVYYPDCKSAGAHRLYDNGQDAPVSQPSVSGVGVSSSTQSAPLPSSTPRMGGSSTQSDGSIIVKITNENRINVPQKMVDQVDQSGGSIDFFVNGTLHPITPTKDGRVRFNTSTLDITSDEITLRLSSGNRSITITT
jgi:hypothetical protein